jgi:alcohol dehydrogenase, propanol-preferring
MAMGYRAIGLDIAEGALEEARHSGAEHAFNSMTDKDYVAKVLEITNGGVHAAVNFTASKKAYDAMPSVIRPTGVLMAVGIPFESVTFNIFDIAMHRFEIRGANNGTCYGSKLPNSSDS